MNPRTPHFLWTENRTTRRARSQISRSAVNLSHPALILSDMSTTNNKLADPTHRNATARKPDEGALQQLSARSMYYAMWILTDQGRWRAVQKSLLLAPVLWFVLEPYRPRTGTARSGILWRLGNSVHEATRLPDATGRSVHYLVALGVIVSICALAATVYYETHRVNRRYSGPHRAVVNGVAVCTAALAWTAALNFLASLGNQNLGVSAIKFFAVPIYVTTIFGIAVIPRPLTSYVVGSLLMLTAAVLEVRSAVSSSGLVRWIAFCSPAIFMPRFFMTWPEYFRAGQRFPLAEKPESQAAILRTGGSLVGTFIIALLAFKLIPFRPHYPAACAAGISYVVALIANTHVASAQSLSRSSGGHLGSWPAWALNFYRYPDMAAGLGGLRQIAWPLIPAILLESYGMTGLATVPLALSTFAAHLRQNPMSVQDTFGRARLGR